MAKTLQEVSALADTLTEAAPDGFEYAVNTVARYSTILVPEGAREAFEALTPDQQAEYKQAYADAVKRHGSKLDLSILSDALQDALKNLV